ncbi:methyl-accepting chemotaxis protein [Dictyobacter formicarum]|uniref:methyl-accepting chemotaxis protein n=1 Tax=Dictyobacter formicarum TaxID=2778368 RepID=UPI001916A1A6|nr:methyl-accepting chemotaxis protein [Dictyobacter formicarum]
MSERKTQSRYLPLRVRIRSSSEQTPPGREEVSVTQEHTVKRELERTTTNSYTSEKERYIHQTRELVRLCSLLRADLDLSEVLQQIVASTAACTGFRILNINLLDQSGKMLSSVASIGLSEEDARTLRETPFSREAFSNAMLPEFRISQSYFIPHGRNEALSEMPTLVVTEMRNGAHGPGNWHPEDNLIIPLYSPRKQELLGFLSLDDPEDGKVPTAEAVEVAELFANQAAIAIDNVRIFQEREAEHHALETAVSALSEEIQLLSQGDMRPRISSQHPRLQPIADTLNSTIDRISVILHDMRRVAQAVDAHMQNVQQNSEMLVHDTHIQEVQIDQISRTINDFAQMMSRISERAAHLSKTAIDGVDVTNEAQTTVDRTVESMGLVREATLQSARMMKQLSESGQEINETVAGMNDLTMRMHLLALNAAIEATRAGENGQGFTVIAQEMRTLAMSSAEIARTVSTYIHTIQQETTKASQSVEQGTQEVVKQTELVMQTGVALDAIGVVTDQLTHLIDGICTTAESQSQGSQLVVNAITEILRMTGDVTRHMREMQHSTSRLAEFTNALRSRLALIRLRDEQ